MPSILSRAVLVCVILCFLTFVRATPVDYDAVSELEERQITTPENCASGIHLIVAPGKGAAGKNGLLQTLINKVKNQYPGSNARTIKYDLNAPNGVIQEARPRYVRYVKNYAKSCPSTPIFLLGYSAGGIIAMDTLCGNSEGIGPATSPISSQYTNNIMAMVAYGEESWRTGQSYDAQNSATCPKDAPMFPRQNPGGCSAFASVMRSYCNGDDGSCCADAIGAPSAHKDYPADYDTDAFNFVMTQYNNYRTRHPLGIIPIPNVNVAPLANADGFY